MKKQIYLASPLGFSETGREFMYKKLIPILQENFIVVNPWDISDKNKIEKALSMELSKNKVDVLKKINYEIAKSNCEAIDSCEYVFAILDGVDVDSGTASEIGYGYAQGKKIYGYRGDFRLSSDNIGSIVNLQVEYFIKDSGGKIFTSISQIKSFDF